MLDVDAALRRLPAQVRASVAWARKPIADAVARLRSEPLTDELVATATEEMMRPLGALAQAARQTLAANVDAFRAAMMTDFDEEQRKLGAFVASDDSAATLAWVTGFLRSFSEAALLFPPAPLGGLDENTWRGAAGSPELVPFAQGIAALMAAAEEGRSGASPERARELIDVAFLHLVDFRDALRRDGFQLAAFPYDTTNQRRERLKAAAFALRDVFADEDWRVLEEARVHDLR